MPAPLSRRELLKLLGLGLGTAACSRLPVPPDPTASPSTPTVRLQTATQVPLPPTETVVQPSATPADAQPTPQPQATATQLALPFPRFIVDGHQDIAWNALEFGRDPRQSAYDVRRREAHTDISSYAGIRTTGLPEYLAGRVGLIFATIFVLPSQNAHPGQTATVYATPRQAEARGMTQLDYYRGLCSPDSRFRLVASQADLEVVVNSWSYPPGQEPSPALGQGSLPAPGQGSVPTLGPMPGQALAPLVGLVILMEGADPILDPDDLSLWVQAGLRIIGPAWHATRYSGGTGAPGPLTDPGRRLLKSMAQLNLLLDLSHLSQEAYFEAVDSYPAQMIASHSNPRRFSPTDRGLSDQMIQKLVLRDGVIGVNLFNEFLAPGWTYGDPRTDVTLERICEVIDHIVQLAGTARHVAIGSDLDGGFGQEAIPFELDTCADLLNLVTLLEKRGYSREDIENILSSNWLRCLANSLPEQ